MSVLHELLAVEKHRNAQVDALSAETATKFGKYDFFSGAMKTLKMLEDSPANTALETAAATRREVPTTVHETLEYLFDHWATAEDVQVQKNVTNQKAKGVIEIAGLSLPELPVDELLGLEVRLTKIRALGLAMPSLNAAKAWTALPERKGLHRTMNEEITTKTEKIMYPVVLAPESDKHPAQVKETTKDVVVGTFKLIEYSGGATTEQKAEFIARIDALIAAVKQARMRANMMEIEKVQIGKTLTDWLMAPFTG